MINIYNKNSIVYHFPGNIICNKYLWKKLIRFGSKKNKNKKFKLENTTLITWSNKKNQPLENCLNNMGVSYKKLGMNINDWKNIVKIMLTIDYIKHVKTKYIIGLDCCDVLVLRNPNLIIEKFNKFNCKMLFNSQSICYPKKDQEGKNYDFVDFEESLNKNKYKNCYLNSGAWVAETEFCRVFFDKCSDILKNNNFNKKEIYWEISDQAYIRKTFMFFEKEVKLDYEKKIFQVIENSNH